MPHRIEPAASPAMHINSPCKAYDGFAVTFFLPKMKE
jgi:hypothetical protein